MRSHFSWLSVNTSVQNKLSPFDFNKQILEIKRDSLMANGKTWRRVGETPAHLTDLWALLLTMPWSSREVLGSLKAVVKKAAKIGHQMNIEK